MYFAHSRKDRTDLRPWQLLGEHLEAVADRAEEFAHPRWKGLARLAGLWHDCGKYQKAFQNYIVEDPEASNEGGARRVLHAIVGAALAFDLLGETESGLLLALVIEAHHGALKSPGDVHSAMRERGMVLLQNARRDGLPAELESHRTLDAEGTSALAVRMVFSALIDADLLDTEAWANQRERENEAEPLPILMARLENACLAKMEDAVRAVRTDSERSLAAMRKRVYEDCIAAATLPPGLFTLTVPTGGGKTLSGMAFALRHAVQHGKQRVIVVAPYTSILEQTAEVYRSVLGRENVIEHHSSISPTVDTDRNRQASENWDAPVIVTTSVQFFESLHAAHKRQCRKLHRIANSVVLLDEVQTFPSALLKPIHAVLTRLADEFGTTVVHGTATQPLLGTGLAPDPRQRKKHTIPFQATELMPHPASLFDGVRSRFRVEILDDLKKPLDPHLLTEDVRKQHSALVITHRRDDARMLAEMLGETCLHLSAAMCAAHRSAVLAEARHRLDKHEPCILVATQLVEAGVDIDFPVVYRAMAGLETLAQAAGRCNRAMKMPEPGRFVVFCAGTPGLDDEPIRESKPPRGTPMLGKQIAEQFFADGVPDLNDPGLFPLYSQRVLTLCDTDANAIEGDETVFNFPAVAANFHMIDEELSSVVVPYGDSSSLLAALRHAGPSRDRYRALQRYVVGVRKHLFDELLRSGWLESVRSQEGASDDGLWCIREGDLSPYDLRFGLVSRPGNVKLRPLVL